MANTRNAKKAVRKAAKRRLLNRYQAKTTRNAVKNLDAMDSADEKKQNLGKVIAMIDKMAKKNIIHKNKASNLKSKLMKRVLTVA